MYKQLKTLIKKPYKIITHFAYKGFLKNMDDAKYLKMQYKLKFKKELNLEHPKTFNEKIQWLKINDRNPEYTKWVDKYEVRKIIADKIGEEYLIPLLGVYNSTNEIDFDKLPNQFVLKCTHDSGGIIVCTDKSKLNQGEVKKRLNKRLKTNFYWSGREWPYKDVKPRIVCEQYMTDESGWELKDYKVFCFNGKPKYIEVDYNRYVSHKLNLYDTEWNFIDAYLTSPNDKDVEILKPKKLELMLELAARLAENTIFLRVDFYSIEDRLYCGEITLSPGSGFVEFHPEEMDLTMGNDMVLPIDL